MTHIPHFILQPYHELVQLNTALMQLCADALLRREHEFVTTVVDRHYFQISRDGMPEDTPEERRYIEDRETGAFYLYYTTCQVRIVAALVLCALPFYTAFQSLRYTSKIIYDVHAFGHRFFCACAGRHEESLYQLGYEGLEVIFLDLFSIVKSPLFAVGAAFAALYTLSSRSPYQGRKIEALIENAWQGMHSYREDVRYHCSMDRVEERESRISQTIKELFTTDRPCYLAWCFQVRGDASERRFSVRERLALS